jgi:hypothetical protein
MHKPTMGPETLIYVEIYIYIYIYIILPTLFIFVNYNGFSVINMFNLK